MAIFLNLTLYKYSYNYIFEKGNGITGRYLKM